MSRVHRYYLSRARNRLLTAKLTYQVITRSDLRNGNYIGGWYREFLLNHPLGGGDDEPLQVVALADSRVVGKINRIPGRIMIDGVPTTVGWGAGLYVDQEFRNSGAGALLVLRLQTLEPIAAVVGVSQAAKPLYEKLGWTMFVMPRYVLLRRGRVVLEKYLSARTTAVARPFVDAALWSCRQMLKAVLALKRRGYWIEPLEVMPEELDDRRSHADKSVVCFRSAAWINHTFRARPNTAEETHKMCLVRDRGGHVVGYFAITVKFHGSASTAGFRNLSLGSVKDWMSFEPERLNDASIILLAIGELIDTEIDAIEVCVPEKSLSHSLRRLGMVRRGELLFFYKASVKSPFASVAYGNPSNWWFRPADGDNFFF